MTTTDQTATPTVAAEPAQPNVEAPESPVQAPEPTEDTGNAEAAKYRRRAVAAETERDTLRTTVEALQRAQVEDLAGRVHGLARPSAMWALADAKIGDLLGQDGTVDPVKVSAAVATAVETLGLRVSRPGGLPASPNAARETRTEPAATWAGFLSGK